MAVTVEHRYLQLDKREQKILNLADELFDLIGQAQLDEAWLDSQFLFRFDPCWASRSEDVRRTMRIMLGKEEDGVLAESDRIRWYMHLSNNFGFSPSEYPPTTPNPYYSLEPPGAHYQEAGQWQDHTQAEAHESLEVRDRLIELAEAFNLLPSLKQAKEWSPQDLERQFEAVVSWVIFHTDSAGRPQRVVRDKGGVRVTEVVTLLPWRVTRLEELELGTGLCRWVRPRAWDFHRDGTDPTRGSGRRMSFEVRIRTWAIYNLSKRGGGCRTEDGAVWVWNEIHPEPERPAWRPRVANYKKERKRLFQRGTLKKE